MHGVHNLPLVLRKRKRVECVVRKLTIDHYWSIEGICKPESHQDWWWCYRRYINEVLAALKVFKARASDAFDLQSTGPLHPYSKTCVVQDQHTNWHEMDWILALWQTKDNLIIDVLKHGCAFQSPAHLATPRWRTWSWCWDISKGFEIHKLHSLMHVDGRKSNPLVKFWKLFYSMLSLGSSSTLIKTHLE